MYETKNRVGKDAALLTFAKVMTTLISLLSAMLLSRFRTLSEYGTYSQLLIVITLATSLLMLGLPNSINYYLARATDEEERRRFLSIYYTLNTIIAFVIGFVLVVCIPLIEQYFSNDLIRDFAYFLLVFPWANVTISSISNVLVVYQKASVVVIINILNALISLFSVMIVKIMNWSFAEYMIIFLVGNVLLASYVYVIILKITKSIKPFINTTIVKEIFKYSIPIGFATMIGTINVELDKLMIGKLLDTESVAIYTNAGKELPLSIVASSLTAVVLPQMVRKIKGKDTLSAIKLWRDSIDLSYIFMAFFTMACVAFAPQVITILYSEKYLPGVNVFVVYSLVLLMRTTYWGMVLSSIGRTKEILYSSIAALVLNIILNYSLFLLVGFVGPAIASLLSIFIVALLQLYLSTKYLNVQIRDILPIKNLFVTSAICLLQGLFVKFVVWYFNIGVTMGDIIKSICFGLMLMLIYFALHLRRIKKLWSDLNE